MRLATKLGTSGAIALVGAGVALGVLAGGSHSAPSASVVVRRVADQAVAPTASPSATRSAVTVVKPAVQNAAPIQKAAPVAVPNDAVAPTDTASPASTSTAAPAAEQGVVGPDGQLRPALPTGPIGAQSGPPPDKPVLSGMNSPDPSPSAS